MSGVFYKGPCPPGGPCSEFRPSYEFKDANATEMTISRDISEVSEWSICTANAFYNAWRQSTVVNSH